MKLGIAAPGFGRPLRSELRERVEHHRGHESSATEHERQQHGNRTSPSVFRVRRMPEQSDAEPGTPLP
jgi:hypothetical protein